MRIHKCLLYPHCATEIFNKYKCGPSAPRPYSSVNQSVSQPAHEPVCKYPIPDTGDREMTVAYPQYSKTSESNGATLY